jgi:hypothetical protein
MSTQNKSEIPTTIIRAFNVNSQLEGNINKFVGNNTIYTT